MVLCLDEVGEPALPLEDSDEGGEGGGATDEEGGGATGWGGGGTDDEDDVTGVSFQERRREQAFQMIHGGKWNSNNRWFDKTMQV